MCSVWCFCVYVVLCVVLCVRMRCALCVVVLCVLGCVVMNTQDRQRGNVVGKRVGIVQKF